MKPKHQRLFGVLVLVLGMATATALTLWALGENLSYFYTPTQVVAGEAPAAVAGRAFRLGGMVAKDSVTHHADGLVSFRVTDGDKAVALHFRGILPDLFREGQGVVAEGRMADDVFVADRLLAKHDENYMPPELKGMTVETAP